MNQMTNNIIQEIRKNPLIEKLSKMPGQSFRIPSMGKLYTNGELDDEVKNGEILLYPMATLDEIYMRTPDMLFQGTAIEKVISRCAPQIKKPLKLFAQDVDYILTCLRKISNGNFIPIKHECSKCNHKAEYNIDIDHFINNSKSFNPDSLSKMEIDLSNNFHISLKPATIEEMLSILQIPDDTVTTPEDMEELITKNLLAVIKSVDGENDREFITEWLKKLPSKIKLEFSQKLDVVNNWGPKFSYNIICEVCEHSDFIETAINPLFFFIQH